MEALSFWLISIVQDEARLTGPNYQTHHPVLRVKKVEFLEELSLWGGHAIKSFTASDAVIEELISFRLTHQILQIPTGTLSFWRLFFFLKPDDARLLEVCSWCWFSAMKRYKVLYCQLYYIYSYLHFYNTFPPLILYILQSL